MAHVIRIRVLEEGVNIFTPANAANCEFVILLGEGLKASFPVNALRSLTGYCHDRTGNSVGHFGDPAARRLRRAKPAGSRLSEGKGHTFESCWVRQEIKGVRSGHMGYGLLR